VEVRPVRCFLPVCVASVAVRSPAGIQVAQFAYRD